MKTLCRFLGVALALLLVSLPAFSQGETGRISGTVTDQTGGAVAGAMVTVTDVARGLSRNLTTDAAGLYAAPNLIPGEYTVQATAMGFQVVQRTNIQVGVGGDIHVDLTLQPGAQTQTVTVTGEAPAVNTTSAQTGGTLENNLINDLPINGGSYRAIVAVLPGVTKLPGSGVDDQSTNGGGVEWDNYMLDGLYDVSVWVNTATVGSTTSSGDTTLLPIDAIQEINLVSNPKAEFGYYPGTTIDVGLKSGTNDFHGSAWAFGRGTAFDARNAFASPSIGSAPAQFEQFGSVFGGPVKKNKIFFFTAFEGARYNVGFPLVTTAPTSASIGADKTNSIPDALADMITNGHGGAALSTLSLNIAGCNAAAVQALTGTVTGATVAADCTKNSYGYSSLFNNTNKSSSVFQEFPDFGGSNNGLGKVDYKISEHHALNAEFYMGDSATTVPPVQGNSALASASTEPWWESRYEVYTRTGRVVEIWTPNSNWLNEARAGYDFQDQPNYNGECGNSTNPGLLGGPSSYLTTYGLNSGTAANGQQGCGFPTMSISGFQTKLDNTSLRLGGGRDLQFDDNVSYSRGTHQFKFGYNLRKQCLCLEAKNGTDGFGNLSFGSSSSLAYSGATALESFLAGGISSEQIMTTANSTRNVHYNMMAAFAQDDWRASAKLTLNIGIRWEGESPATDSHGGLANFDPNTPSGMIQNNQLWPWQSNFSPHFGLAYDVSGKGTTVVRLGASTASVYESMISWTSLAVDAPQAMPTGAILCTSTVATVCGGPTAPAPNTPVTGCLALGSCFQGPGNITDFLVTATPTTASKVITVPLPWPSNASEATSSPASIFNLASTPECSPTIQCTLFGAYPNYKLPWVATWNFSIQHAFNSNLTLNVAYVGSHGQRLNLEGNINAATPGASGSSAENPRRPFWTAANNPWGDAYPYFGSSTFNFNGGRSDYNGLQMTLSERVSHGLTFTGGYTLSHAMGSGSAANPVVMNIANIHGEYGDMPIDFTQRFTLTTTYNIPGIKSPGQLLEGWSIVSNLTVMTPPAITASDGVDDVSGTGVELDRWNLYGSVKPFNAAIGGPTPVACWGVLGSKFTPSATSTNGCTEVASVGLMPYSCLAGADTEAPGENGATTGLAQLAAIGCYTAGGGNSSALIPPAQGTFGNMQLGSLRTGASGGFKNWDLAVHKDWKFKERYSAQFRAEFFNVTNRADYYLPDTNLGQPGQFGASFSTPDVGKGTPVTGLGGPREMQLGFKLAW